MKKPGKSEAQRQKKRVAREKHHGLGQTGLRPGDASRATVVTDHAGVGRGGTARAASRPATRKKD